MVIPMCRWLSLGCIQRFRFLIPAHAFCYCLAGLHLTWGAMLLESSFFMFNLHRQNPHTHTSGKLAALRMLLIHGDAFALQAVTGLYDSADAQISAQDGASAILLGTRAILRL